MDKCDALYIATDSGNECVLNCTAQFSYQNNNQCMTKCSTYYESDVTLTGGVKLKICTAQCSETDYPYMQKHIWDGTVTETICVKACPDDVKFSDDGVCSADCASKYFAIKKN